MTQSPLLITDTAHSGDAAHMRIACASLGRAVLRGAWDNGDTPALASLTSTIWLKESNPWPSAFAPLMDRPHGVYRPGDAQDLPNNVWLKPTIPKAYPTLRMRRQGKDPWDGWQDKAWYWSCHIPGIVGEIRVYVANGKIIHWEQYGDAPDDVELPRAHQDRILSLTPSDWVGTVDVAVCRDARIRLIECHEPYACGLYGAHRLSVAHLLLGWIDAGWEWLVKNRAQRSPE